MKDQTRAQAVRLFSDKVKDLYERNSSTRHYNLAEFGEQYGFQRIDRNNLSQEHTAFARAEILAVQQEATEKAQAIVNKLLAQLEKELEAEGVELRK